MVMDVNGLIWVKTCRRGVADRRAASRCPKPAIRQTAQNPNDLKMFAN